MNRLRQIRQLQDMRQVELAMAAGIEPSLVCLIEKGKRCSQPTAEKLAQALGVAVVDIFDDYALLREW